MHGVNFTWDLFQLSILGLEQSIWKFYIAAILYHSQRVVYYLCACRLGKIISIFQGHENDLGPENDDTNKCFSRRIAIY